MSPPKGHRNNGKHGFNNQKRKGSSHQNRGNHPSSSGRPTYPTHSHRRPSHSHQTSHSNKPNQPSHSSHSKHASQPSTSSGGRSGNNSKSGHKPRTPPPHNKQRSFKLLVDPFLVKGSKKIYRVEGVVPGDNTWTLTCLKDPRPSITRIWTRLEIMELPVPKFKIDDNYVGDPPGIEVLLTNLNDNIDRHFLADMIHKFGPTEKLVIYYHPVSHKHLGVARAVFEQVEDASACVATLHMKSVMGKQLNVKLDPFGKECASLIELLTTDKKKEVVDVPPPPPEPPEESENEEKKSEQATPPAKNEEYSASATEELQPVQNQDTMMQLVPSYGHNDGAGVGPSVPVLPPLMPPPNMMMPMAPYNQMHQPSHMPYASYPMQPMEHWPQPDMWDMSNMSNMSNMPPMACMWPQPTPWDQHTPFMPQPLMPEREPTLDLDARIELLLKGTNGQLPHFGVLDNNNTPGLLEEKSDPPLPPNDEPEYIPRPPPSISPCTPPLQPPPLALEPFDPDKYEVMSNPPSPFIGDEEYLESLLNMKLKHLALVKKTQKESRRLKKLENPDLVLDSTSSSDEEKPEKAPASDDDRMSLASMSSNNDKIEEVTEPPPETFESTSYNSASMQVDIAPHYQQSMTVGPDIRSLMPPSGLGPYGWMPYNPAAAQFNMPRMFWPGHEHGPGPSTSFPINIPRPRPFHPPPLLPPGSYPAPNRYRYRRPTQTPAKPTPVKPAAKESNPIDIIVDLALEQICKLVQSTLENDLHKRMTETIAFKELDLWWDAEEKKHKEKFQQETQEEKKKEREETRTTTENLLNAIIDSTEDGYMPTDGLGFKAALPKLPSFKRKTVKEAPPVIVQCTSVKKRHDSDKEEMVEMSDSDSNSEVESASDKIVKRKSKAKLLSSSSSASPSSASPSPSPSSSSESSDSESEPSHKPEVKADLKPTPDTTPVPAKKAFLCDDVFHRFKEKTPEKRHTPIPLDYFSEEDYSQPPKTPDIHLSETEDVPMPKIPATQELGGAGPSAESQRRETAFEALAVLGLDEFVCDIKFRDGPTKGSSRVVRTPSPTLPLTPTTPDFAEVKEPPVTEKKERRKIRKKKRVMETTVEKTKIIICKKSEEKIVKCRKVAYSSSQRKAPSRIYSDSDSDSSIPSPRHKPSHRTTYDNLRKSPRTVYEPRDQYEELMTACSYLTDGLDEEDKEYLRITYERLLTDDNQADWLNDSHWVDYPVMPPNRKSNHMTGCARAEGFYKIDPREKLKNKHHLNKDRPCLSETQNSKLPAAHSQTQVNREVRSNQRRLLTTHGEYSYADLLKFNQLKLRNKSLQFGKSEIHDWGLFALEHIAADEMVIEYVGELIRPEIANVREKAYQKMGIGSSYLFRIDEDTIVDATNRGNPARFINHSCNPNCYAKIITIQGEKKVVIYSKRDIRINEEITYDYKFPFEDEKIPCLCGTPQCKGFLN